MGEIKNEGRLKGWALKVETCLSPEMATSTEGGKRGDAGRQKVGTSERRKG